MSTPQDKARAEAEKEYPMMSGVNISERVENAISEERRAAFIKGYLRACEHSPDIVDADSVWKLIEAHVLQTNPSGWGEHITLSKDTLRSAITSLFKPQP